MDWLADVVKEETGNNTLTREVLNANTARHAFGMIWPEYLDVLEKVGRTMITALPKNFARPRAGSGPLFMTFKGVLPLILYSS